MPSQYFGNFYRKPMGSEGFFNQMIETFIE